MNFPYTILLTPSDRPIVPVFLEQNDRRLLTHGLLDSGADTVLLPYRSALNLGVMLGPPRTIGTATGHLVSYRPGTITLELRCALETIRWRAEVGLTAAPLSIPLFGDKGFLEFFRSEFDGQLREVELKPKGNLPRIS